MARHKAPRQEALDHWKTFTMKIFHSWDADPGYYAIQYTDGLSPAQQSRFAVAWCTYYNLGIAADASEYMGDRFWCYLESIYDTAKRNTERRHFRGKAGLVALEQWRTRWRHPEAMAEHICGDAQTYFDIRKRCSDIAQFGDYFYWKWCDLTEVLGYRSLDMSGSAKYSPKVPQQGALLIEGVYSDNSMAGPTNTEVIEKVYAKIARFGRVKDIPPRTTEARKFSIQEAETVCCVYKQMASGSYVYGSRTAKAVARLGAAKTKTAINMRNTLLELSPFRESELADILTRLTGK